MRTFDHDFAVRHQRALAALAERIGLDYFTVDCAENRRGELLIFEADNTAVVHNMDSPDAVSLQAATDEQDIRGIRRDAVPPRPRRPRACDLTDRQPKKMLACTARGFILRDARKRAPLDEVFDPHG